MFEGEGCTWEATVEPMKLPDEANHTDDEFVRFVEEKREGEGNMAGGDPNFLSAPDGMLGDNVRGSESSQQLSEEMNLVSETKELSNPENGSHLGGGLCGAGDFNADESATKGDEDEVEVGSQLTATLDTVWEEKDGKNCSSTTTEDTSPPEPDTGSSLVESKIPYWSSLRRNNSWHANTYHAYLGSHAKCCSPMQTLKLLSEQGFEFTQELWWLKKDYFPDHEQHEFRVIISTTRDGQLIQGIADSLSDVFANEVAAENLCCKLKANCKIPIGCTDFPHTLRLRTDAWHILQKMCQDRNQKPPRGEHRVIYNVPGHSKIEYICHSGHGRRGGSEVVDRSYCMEVARAEVASKLLKRWFQKTLQNLEIISGSNCFKDGHSTAKYYVFLFQRPLPLARVPLPRPSQVLPGFKTMFGLAEDLSNADSAIESTGHKDKTAGVPDDTENTVPSEKPGDESQGTKKKSSKKSKRKSKNKVVSEGEKSDGKGESAPSGSEPGNQTLALSVDLLNSKESLPPTPTETRVDEGVSSEIPSCEMKQSLEPQSVVQSSPPELESNVKEESDLKQWTMFGLTLGAAFLLFIVHSILRYSNTDIK